MPDDDAPGRHAREAGSRDEVPLLDAQCLAADDSRHIEPVHGADCNEDEKETAAERDHEQDHEEDERHRIQRIDKSHHQGTDAAAEVAGYRTVTHTDHEAHEARDCCDEQSRARSRERANEQVPTEFVGAEEMRTFE